MRAKLNNEELMVLQLVDKLRAQRGKPPTIDDLARVLNTPKTMVVDVVAGLRSHGYLKLERRSQQLRRRAASRDWTQTSKIERKIRKTAPTEKQARILDYIKSYTCECGSPPTIRQIGEEFGIKSPNGVTCHLAALKKKGLLDDEPGQRRSLRVTKGVAIVGEVS